MPNLSITSLIEIYCLIQNFCSVFISYLTMGFYTFLQTIIPDYNIFSWYLDALSNSDLADFLNTFSLIEFIFGSALVFVIGFNIVKWIIDILP